MRLVTVSLLCTLALSSPVMAKETSDSKVSSKDSSDALVTEIVNTVKAAKLTEEEKQEQKKVRNARVESILTELEAKGQIPPDAKAKILAGLRSDKPVHEHVPGVDSAWTARLNLDEFCASTTSKVLTDHLDNQDLKNVLKFLKTPTGQKIIKQTPDMLSEAFELTVARFLPPLMELGKQFAKQKMMQPKELTPEQMEKQKEMMNKIKDLLRQNQQSSEPKPDET
ncbi:MAG: DUF2059 domain-containing protein [Candidatus Obscuribacterales bacterium]|nr:DUF2059 domain-containing protein [Candidatus Obscuribacterales bacterium]